MYGMAGIYLRYFQKKTILFFCEITESLIDIVREVRELCFSFYGYDHTRYNIWKNGRTFRDVGKN